ncbi:nucleolar protein dao-5-like [Schistocerca gregaria]|uniref:nucleolar protein dao-5-like n=1 Tax=Schistocerca gregaria TaxID=7010 RepID=UPI00211E9F03|nr:nucleolar protein dao-5-like [Schistocerca gregaria]
MDTETGDTPTASTSRYADPALAGEASGAAGPSRQPPMANRRTKSVAKKTRCRFLTTSDGLPSLTVARVLDVGGPQTPSPTSTKTTQAAARGPEDDSSNGAPMVRKNGGATATTEADKHLQFLMGLIPGAQKSGNQAENPALKRSSRKRRADTLHDASAKRPAAGTSSSAPEMRTKQKTSRKGTRTPPETDEDGFTKPTRKHTARAVVLTVAADGVNTANRYSGLPDAAAEATDAEQQKRTPPPPPVVIRWEGAFKEFETMIKQVVKGSFTTRTADRDLYRVITRTADGYRGVTELTRQAFKRAAARGRPAPSRPVQAGKSFAAAAAASAAPMTRPAQRPPAHPADVHGSGRRREQAAPAGAASEVQGRGRRREQPALTGAPPAAESTPARAENRRGRRGGRPNDAPTASTPAEQVLPPPTQTTETPAAPSEAAELREFEQLILQLPQMIVSALTTASQAATTRAALAPHHG